MCRCRPGRGWRPRGSTAVRAGEDEGAKPKRSLVQPHTLAPQKTQRPSNLRTGMVDQAIFLGVGGLCSRCCLLCRCVPGAAGLITVFLAKGHDFAKHEEVCMLFPQHAEGSVPVGCVAVVVDEVSLIVAMAVMVVVTVVVASCTALTAAVCLPSWRFCEDCWRFSLVSRRDPNAPLLSLYPRRPLVVDKTKKIGRCVNATSPSTTTSSAGGQASAWIPTWRESCRGSCGTASPSRGRRPEKTRRSAACAPGEWWSGSVVVILPEK